MTKQGKVWGFTQLIHANPVYEFHRIEIMKDAFCSVHSHKHKWNGFFVESGLLKICVWKDNYHLVDDNSSICQIDETILNPGDFTSVGPGEFHQFWALEPTIAYETYWASPLDINDIVRKTVGGKKDNK